MSNISSQLSFKNPCEDCVVFASCKTYYMTKNERTDRADRLLELAQKCPKLEKYIIEYLKKRLKAKEVQIYGVPFIGPSDTHGFVYIHTPFQLGVTININYKITRK